MFATISWPRPACKTPKRPMGDNQTLDSPSAVVESKRSIRHEDERASSSSRGGNAYWYTAALILLSLSRWQAKTYSTWPWTRTSQRVLTFGRWHTTLQLASPACAIQTFLSRPQMKILSSSVTKNPQSRLVSSPQSATTVGTDAPASRRKMRAPCTM